jgi:tRNA pseudouridine65 synthase
MLGSLADLHVLYVDAHLVVVNKPSGLLVHRGWDNDDDVMLFRVRDALGGAHVHPVHRLDRGTSGALLLARTKAAASRLAEAFEHHRVDKRYLALVRGHPPESGTIEYPIPKSEGGARVPAVTRFRAIARSTVERCSLVEAEPLSGRLHQIRRHLRHLGHPLIGDVKYGSGALNRHYRAAYQLHRLALHATSIGFAHPDSGAPLSVRAPLPDDLAQALAALGLGAAAARQPESAPNACDAATKSS